MLPIPLILDLEGAAPPPPSGLSAPPLALLLLRRFGVAGPAPVAPPDLIAAIITRLRATPAIVTGFGDGASTPKFFADEAQGQPALPYMRIEELGESESGQTADGGGIVYFDSRGQVRLDVYGIGKQTTRQLQRSLISALTDAALTNSDAAVLYFRPAIPIMPPVPDIAPDGPQCYRASVTFDYILDRAY